MLSERAKVLFEELADEPSAARVDRLAELSTAEAAEMRALLEALDSSPGFLDVEGVVWRERLAPREPAIGPGSRIGSFSIVREIGRGGMGVVYEAMQDAPLRHVALKIMRPGTPSRADLIRFRREAEMLGLLNHAGIATVYEARMQEPDDESGERTPFIAMEYVEGLPINQYVAERRLDVPSRIRLMVEACRAIHHAHGNRVIHRDISPSNVMVDRTGHVKIVDFGVARMSEVGSEASFPTIGDRVLGKWGYVSPEQALREARDVDHRTDVFALGAVLYELLSGRVWLSTEGRSPFELMRAIELEEPRHWPTLGCAREDDLWAVVETAMRKERARRYPSAAELADELERWLRDEAVIARPMGSTERLGRFVQANRGLSAALGALALALIGGTVASSVMAFRARSAEDRLVAGLGAVMDGILAPLANQRSTMDAREATLKSIESGIEQIRRVRPGDRRVQIAVARYEFEWGKLLGYPYWPNLSKRHAAVERFRAGLALLAPAGAAALENEEEARLAVKAVNMLGATLLIDGLHSEAELEAREALRACDRWIGRSALNSKCKWLNHRSEMLLVLSQALANRGNRAGGEAAARDGERVLWLHEPVNPEEREAFEYGSAWIGIGVSYFRLDLHPECIAAMKESQRFLDRFAEPGRTDDTMLINTVDPHWYIARSLAAIGDFVGAERVCTHAISLLERVRAAAPERPDTFIGFALLLGERAAARAALGDLNAVNDARAAVEHRRLRLAEDPNAQMGFVGLARALNELGNACTSLMRAGCVTDSAGDRLAGQASVALDEADRLIEELTESPLEAQTWCEVQATRVGLERAMRSE